METISLIDKFLRDEITLDIFRKKISNKPFVNKLVNDDMIKKYNGKFINACFEKTTSFNKISNTNQDTKLVIVGTITPPLCKADRYFYTSPNNKVYKIIDNYFGIECSSGKSLVKMKKKLSDCCTNYEKTKCIEDIKNILNEHKIAFIDVIDSVIRFKNSSDDRDIVLFSFDQKSFNKAKHVNNFICNSKNACACFQENKFGETKKFYFCPQDQYHYKEQTWYDALNCCFR